jgi:hypothetical protein
MSNSSPFPHPGGIGPCLISLPLGGEGAGNLKKECRNIISNNCTTFIRCKGVSQVKRCLRNILSYLMFSENQSNKVDKIKI